MDFNPKRLALARARRRLTAKALAERAKMPPITISRLEKGKHIPEPETMRALAWALDYPFEFFTGDEADEINTGAVSFRSFSKMTARDRDAALAAGSLGLLLNEWVEDRFGLPTPDFPEEICSISEPEVAAANLRQYWGIGVQPIGNLLGLLEEKGVRLFALSENTSSVNAFSFWKGDKPYIFLNNFKSPESSRFDAAHELGHLVMHRHGDPKSGGRSVEKEADRFASAFLMPREDVLARIPRNITTEEIIQAKKCWRVSAMALTYRLHQIGRLTDWEYKFTCIDFSRRGYRREEPNGTHRDTSIVWEKVLTELWREKVTRDVIARDLNIPAEEINGLIGSLLQQNSNEEKIENRSLREV